MAITAIDTARAVRAPETEACSPQLACLLIDREEAERMAAMLKAIADPTRLQILRLIERSPTGRRASAT